MNPGWWKTCHGSEFGMSEYILASIPRAYWMTSKPTIQPMRRFVRIMSSLFALNLITKHFALDKTSAGRYALARREISLMPDQHSFEAAGRPYLVANFAQTIDGKVQGPGAGYWPVGSGADHELLLDLRAECDVLV